MSISVTERTRFPKRRDGQIPTTRSEGGAIIPAGTDSTTISGINIHNSLYGLQGGNADEYYHLTEEQYLGFISNTGTPSENQVALWDDVNVLKGSADFVFSSNFLKVVNKIGVYASMSGSSFILDGSNMETLNDFSNVRIVAGGYSGIGYLKTKLDNWGGFFSWYVGSSGGDVELFRIDASTGNILQPDFVSGFNGDKWCISKEGNAEFESLVIRSTLKAYEFVIDKIRASNGAIWVSDSMRVDSVVEDSVDYVCYFDNDGGNIVCSFAVDDIVKCQVWAGEGVKYYVGKVLHVGSDYFTITLIDGGSGDVPESGDVLVRIGNATNTSRQGSIYLTASDTYAPYIDVLDGVTDENILNKVRVRLGRLEGITDSELGALSGYGLWSDNAYLSGKIILPNAGLTNEVNSSNDVVIWSGASYEDRNIAPFRVTSDGSLTATGVAELGTNTANYEGKTSNIAIKNADIWENSYNGDNSAIHINRVGYQGGTSKYRHVRVYDGKGTAIFAIQGDLGITYTLNFKCVTAAVFNGTAEIEGKLTCDGTVEFNDTTQFDALATHNANVYIPNNKLCVGSSSPNAYACVDFSAGKRNGTNPGALVLPIMTTSQRDSLVATQGMIIYNSTTGLIDVCTAAGWRYLQTATY